MTSDSITTIRRLNASAEGYRNAAELERACGSMAEAAAAELRSIQILRAVTEILRMEEATTPAPTCAPKS